MYPPSPADVFIPKVPHNEPPMTSRSLIMCRLNRLGTAWLFAFSLFLATAPAPAQEKSIKPGINKSFAEPDVKQFIERFEREGRDVFDSRNEVVAACKIKPGTSVADIGAGTGLFTRMFSPLVGSEGRVYAVDIAENFLDHIQKTAADAKLSNIVGIMCDQHSTKLPPASIDMAFICDTYHHFEFPHKTIRSVHRALRPGGQVVLIEFRRVKGVSSDWIMEHVRAGQETFTKEIVAAGFKQVEEKKFLKQSYFVRFTKVDDDK